MNALSSMRFATLGLVALATASALAEYDDYVKIHSDYVKGSLKEVYGDSPLNYNEAQPSLYNKANSTSYYYWENEVAPTAVVSTTKYYLDGAQFRGPLSEDKNTLYKAGIFNAVWPTEELRLGPKCQILWKWYAAGCSFEFPHLVTMSGAGLYYNANVGVAELRGKLTVNGTLKLTPGSTSGANAGWRIKSQVIGDADATISSYQFDKKTYIGWVEYAGDMTSFKGTISVNSNMVYFASPGFSSGKVVASNLAYVGPRAGANERVSLADLTMDASSSLLLNSTNVLVLTGSFAHGALPLKVSVDLDASEFTRLPFEGKTYTLLELTKGDWTIDDFNIESSVDLASYPKAYYEVQTSDAENVQRLVLVVPPYVKLLHGGKTNAGLYNVADSPFYGTAAYTDDKGTTYYWSDSEAPQSGKVYVIDNMSAFLPEPTNGVDHWTFNGDMLWTRGATTVLRFDCTTASLKVDELLAANTDYTAIYDWRPDGVNRIIGNTLTINSPVLRAEIRNRAVFVFDTALRGSGAFEYKCTATTTNASTSATVARYGSRSSVALTRENYEFTGNFSAYAEAKSELGFSFPDEEACGKVVVTSGYGLGGPIETFGYNSISFCDYSTLVVTNSLTLSMANRGFFVGGSKQNPACDIARINVSNAADVLTFNLPITYAGELRKEGCGLLTLGAKARFGLNNALDDETAPTEGKNVLKVQNGSIMAGHAEAIKGLAVAFSAGAGIAVNAEAIGDLATYGFKGAQSMVADGAIKVTPRNVTAKRPFSVAICTLPKTTDLTTASFAAERAGKMRGLVASRDNGDDTVTFYASYESSGMMLMFR